MVEACVVIQFKKCIIFCFLVKKLLGKAAKNCSTTSDVKVSGYNITKLVLLADRLKRYRVSRTLSQAKLSRKIAATSVGALKFSQSFLCRYILFLLLLPTLLLCG